MAQGTASREARLAHHNLASRQTAKADQVEADTLAGSGIEPVPVDQYWVNGFRYASLGDVLAKAKRGLAQ